MKKILLLFAGCYLLLSLQSFADSPTLTQYESAYRRAYKLEQYRLYKQASVQYREIYIGFNRKVAKEGVSRIPSEYFPVVISSMVRQGFITSQSQYWTFNKLVDQIDAFTETIDQINQLITIISDYNDGAANPVAKSQYAELFYVRGLCQIGLAGKLLEGISWKNYVVYPPNDVIQMLEFAMADFHQSLLLGGMPIYSVSFQPKTTEDPASFQAFLDARSKRLSNISANGPEFSTLRLINMEASPDKLARLLAKRDYYQAYQAMAFMDSSEMKNSIAQSRNYYTLDKILAADNQPLFTQVSKLIQIVGLRE